MLTPKGKKVYEDCRRHVLDAVLSLGDADTSQINMDGHAINSPTLKR